MFVACRSCESCFRAELYWNFIKKVWSQSFPGLFHSVLSVPDGEGDTAVEHLGEKAQAEAGGGVICAVVGEDVLWLACVLRVDRADVSSLCWVGHGTTVQGLLESGVRCEQRRNG